MKNNLVCLAIVIALGLNTAQSAETRSPQNNSTTQQPASPAPVGNEATKNNDKDYAEFFMDKERGWFWYEHLPEEVKEEILKKAQEGKQPKPEDEPLSPAWYRKNFQRYLDLAIQHPNDEEAMKNYLYLEKLMRDRAELFAYQRDKAVSNDPFLDQSSRRSIASFGTQAINAEAEGNRKQLLKQIGEKTGVYYFFSGDDTYSEKQTPLVKLLEKRYGFTVIPVIIRGDVPNDFPWEDVVRNEGQAEFMGVKKIPALYLFNNESGTTGMITQGLYALDEVEKRTLYTAERINLLSKEDALLAKPKDLYQHIDGYVGPLGIPENAPKEFLELYKQSLGQ